MLNLYRATIASLALTVSGMAMSSTDCGPYKVEHIQIEGEKVYFHPVNEGNGSGVSWKSIGSLSVVGTKERLAALLAAQASGKMVTARYSQDNFPCANYDLENVAYMVRISN